MCKYTIYLNLLYTYMMTKSESKVFPIVFKLPSDKYGYNNKTDTYSFRTVAPYFSNNLFDDKRQFIGLHLFKYFKNLRIKKNCNTKI